MNRRTSLMSAKLTVIEQYLYAAVVGMLHSKRSSVYAITQVSVFNFSVI